MNDKLASLRLLEKSPSQNPFKKRIPIHISGDAE
ncbi:hypothetical protein ACP_2622 [Acidobacterium capsulatum ATCC 51196]|uniref:Uncharacterized protein n=1 Tax=Acidobacterium capsulatum (strain ATCC 51196 / DSM 11244 / BCRC 80197 / JCM 7670 / NBRC 15755 / NCIMB 13165 / 161) TaxID=240015 RepID=C1F2G2_ACIC5|nr:hypothetical protein ACP_2622 [Acidobacterium capsulatum ATCC 51196]